MRSGYSLLTSPLCILNQYSLSAVTLHTRSRVCSQDCVRMDWPLISPQAVSRRIFGSVHKSCHSRLLSTAEESNSSGRCPPPLPTTPFFHHASKAREAHNLVPHSHTCAVLCTVTQNILLQVMPFSPSPTTDPNALCRLSPPGRSSGKKKPGPRSCTCAVLRTFHFFLQYFITGHTVHSQSYNRP